jgi:hypothetical protein
MPQGAARRMRRAVYAAALALVPLTAVTSPAQVRRPPPFPPPELTPNPWQMRHWWSSWAAGSNI